MMKKLLQLTSALPAIIMTAFALIFQTFFKIIKRHFTALILYFDPMVISDYSAAFFSRDKNDSNNNSSLSSALCTRQPWWQLSSSSSSSRVYLFPLITIISTTLYGNLLIVCYESAEFSAEDNSSKCNLTVAFLQRSPVVMLHQMLPQVMWSQMDVVYSLGILTVVINYATFLKQPYTAGRYELVKTRRKASSSTSSISVLSISGKGKVKSTSIFSVCLFVA